MIIKEVKSNPYHVLKTFTENQSKHLILRSDEATLIKLTELPILDRYSTGSVFTKKTITDVALKVELEKKNSKEEIKIETPTEKPRPSLKEIDEKLLTIDDFL